MISNLRIYILARVMDAKRVGDFSRKNGKNAKSGRKLIAFCNILAKNCEAMTLNIINHASVNSRQLPMSLFVLAKPEVVTTTRLTHVSMVRALFIFN